MTPSPARRAPRLALLLAAAASLLAACDGGTTADAVVAGDLVGLFGARSTLAPLADALRITGVAPALAGGPFTVFAPTEAALRYIGTDFRPVLFDEPQRQILARVLRHHIVAGRIAPEALTDGTTLTALDGATLVVRRVGPVVTVNGATIDVARPLEADNGVAYPIADVLLDGIESEDRVRLSPSLATLAQGLRFTTVAAEAARLPRVTVLAPINDAFTALGQGSLTLLQDAANRDVYTRLLQTLVLPGDVDLQARVGQTVTTLAGDVLPVTQDANGLISVDGVRVLHAETTADGRFYVLAAPLYSGLTLSQRLRVNTAFAQFLGDVPLVPGLPALLADRGEAVTVFGPPNALYTQRSLNTRTTLRAAQQATLLRRATGVHVVRGRYAPADLTDGLRLTALDGTVLTVRRNNDVVSVDDTPIFAPARLANGYFYEAGAFVKPDVDLLDTVLLAGFADFFKAVRSSGFEAGFRSRARTAWILADADIGPLVQRPSSQIQLLLQRTATTEFIPTLTGQLPRTIETLDGSRRRLEETTCSPRDPTCRPFTFDPYYTVFVADESGRKDSVRVEQPKFTAGQQTQSRTAAWHQLKDPEYRLGPIGNGQGQRSAAIRPRPTASTSASQRS